MIRVYVDMVADLFHYGHVEFLKQARALGDYLLVGVHSDDVVAAHKRKPILTMQERVASVAGCRYVDEVLPEKGLVRVLVTIFGRQAPIELEYWQIQKGD